MTTSYTGNNLIPLNALPTTNGITQSFFVNIANSGPATYAPDGLSAAPIFGLGGKELQGNEMVAGGIATLVSYIGPLLNSGALCWVLFDGIGSAVQVGTGIATQHAATVLQAQTGGLQYVADTGTANSYVIAPSVPVTSLTDNQPFWIKVKTSNTGASTLATSGLTAYPVLGSANLPLQGGELVAGGRALVIWNASLSSYVLIGCTGGALQVASATQGQQAATLAQINSIGTSGVRGLLGNANPSSPATKFDFTTTSRTFRNPTSGSIFTSYNTSIITVDAGLAGPTLNGRDQAAAFSAGSWIYLYALSNGSGSEGGIFSANPPLTGPTALAGYPNSVFITALYWTGAAIRLVVVRGNFVYEGQQIQFGSYGNTGGAEVSISLATVCPPIASRIKARINSLISTNSGGGGTASARYRFISGFDAKEIPLGMPVANATAYDNEEVEFPNVGQTLFLVFILTSGAPNLSEILTNIKSIGYAVPNGDS